ncbi:hypothetical protein LguiA_005089 [Lonicera macranthoides]
MAAKITTNRVATSSNFDLKMGDEQHTDDVHSKVVLSLWLRYKRKKDELLGTSSLDCVRRFLECLKVALIHGYDLYLIYVYDHCKCKETHIEKSVVDNSIGDECYTSDEYDDGDFVFYIGDDKGFAIHHDAYMRKSHNVHDTGTRLEDTAVITHKQTEHLTVLGEKEGEIATREDVNNEK